MKRHQIIVALLCLTVAGCGTVGGANAKPSKVISFSCKPTFVTKPDDLGGKETWLRLIEPSGAVREVLWATSHKPASVSLAADSVYTFTIDTRPDWAASGFLSVGGTLPSGFVRSIRKDNKVIWKDTFYKKRGCY